MRKVMYFLGGAVADFEIADARFEDFTDQVRAEVCHDDGELGKARTVLEEFTRGGEGKTASSSEELAACFVWNYFNTHPDPAKIIQGDVIIVDLTGDGETIEYASVADVQVAPVN